jgi:hypothetical protein
MAREEEHLSSEIHELSIEIKREMSAEIHGILREEQELRDEIGELSRQLSCGTLVSDQEIHADLAATVGAMYGASLVRVSGLMLHRDGVSQPFDDANGEYSQSDDMCNGRPIYTHASKATAMWWANNDGRLSWCVGPARQVGTDVMWAYVESMGFGPEEAGRRAWRVYSYNTASWEKQTGVELCIDVPAEFRASLASMPRRYGAVVVRVSGAVLHLGGAGTSKPYTGVNGDFERTEGVLNGRPVYTHVSMPTAMWWGAVGDGVCGVSAVSGCWCIGPKDRVGTDRMWAYVNTDKTGLGPEEASRRPVLTLLALLVQKY